MLDGPLTMTRSRITFDGGNSRMRSLVYLRVPYNIPAGASLMTYLIPLWRLLVGKTCPYAVHVPPWLFIGPVIRTVTFFQ